MSPIDAVELPSSSLAKVPTAERPAPGVPFAFPKNRSMEPARRKLGESTRLEIRTSP
jgi:hypothetical protein